VDIPSEISLGSFLTEDAADAAAAAGVGRGGGEEGGGPSYRLFAVINHMGTLHGGHYTAMCDAGGGSWFTFNDANVNTSAGGAPQSSSHAYVLLYALK
jgi:ubiquitin C-terminal hydrolase